MEIVGGPVSTWYIDAWAVDDGKVFVSRRPPDSLDAEVTVFMSVPDLEPVPVGRISTALRATRSGFQDGLRDAEGDEIAFESLSQVRTLVRQAYLASGLGPDAPAAAAGPAQRTPGPEDPGATLMGEETRWAEEWEVVTLESEPPDQIERAVDLVAMGSVLSWDRYLWDDDRGDWNPEEMRGLVGWLTALDTSGLLSPSRTRRHHLLEELRDRAPGLGAHTLVEGLHLLEEQWVPHGPFRGGGMIAGYWSRTHLALVPLPLAPRWDRRMARLVEMQLSATVDPRFWRSIRPPTVLDVAPLVLVHAVRRGMRRGLVPGEEPPPRASFRRIPQLLHGKRPPDAAEDALAEFIERKLNGGTSFEGPSPARGPGAAPSGTEWAFG